ncbi:hypothetical protein ACQKG7_02300 [Lysinibacillus fusiformis]|uniref:hypothetical protein n=1 Tax=Lysinibacillus fusiformis TaxID=28031 RepID=UPI0017817F08|nr:hypothetical protein [Lysinibacillus fusiformis]
MKPHNFENNLQTYNNPSDYDALYANYQDDLHYIQRYLGTNHHKIYVYDRQFLSTFFNE